MEEEALRETKRRRRRRERHREKEASLGAVSCYDVGPEVASDLDT